MGVTQTLSKFLLDTTYQDFPQEVVDRARMLAFDFVGGALAGCHTHVSNIFTGYVQDMAAKPEAVVIGRRVKTTAAYASYLNGLFNHSTELESVSQRTSPNPLAVIATALSLGDKMKLSGKSVLEGLILGFEIQGRIGGPSLKGISKKGRISIFNHLGTAAAAAKMIGLSFDQTRMALGTAAFQAGGLITSVGTMAHVAELAYASRDGIEAAELAKRGFTAHPDIIETPQGFCEALIEEGGYDLDAMTRELGKSYQVVDPGISIKKYPCCYRSHRALDAFYDMLDEHRLSSDQVEKISVDMNLYDSYLMKFPEPKTGEEAKFSFRHIFGAALLKGKVWIDSFSDEAAVDPKYVAARARVDEVVHPDWPTSRAEARIPVTIKLKDGRVLSKENATPREPTMNQLVERYREAADGILTRDQTEQSIEQLLQIEKSQDVSQIMALLAVRA
ncbi:MAG: MmgE/PrpD family protein [Burkholderiales bacterium]|nr:MmgE/PrpD family protein [Burkholderiales bacterium]